MPWFGTARSLEDRFLDLLATHPLARKALLDDARGAGFVVSVEGSAAATRGRRRR